jgi:exodeoxyribonuclease VII small subunit
MTKKEDKITFEDALKELELIAEKLDSGQLTLEDSIRAYERGIELKNICTQRLKEAEGKIEFLATVNGKVVKESAIRPKANVSPSTSSTTTEIDDLF